MAFYGFSHTYGENMRDEQGDLIGTLYIFETRAARDAWVEQGGEYRNNPGWRSAVKSRVAARWQRISAAVERA